MNQIILKHIMPPQETLRSCKNHGWHADEVFVTQLPRSTSIFICCFEGRELWINPQSGFWRAPSFVIGENCALILTSTRTNLKPMQLWLLIFCQGRSFKKVSAPTPKKRKKSLEVLLHEKVKLLWGPLMNRGSITRGSGWKWASL